MADLYHHGILGQKHGVKNGPPYPLSEKKHNQVVRKRYKTTDELNDEDLKKAINRMENENKYNKLVADRTRKPDSFAKKFVDKMLEKSVESASQIAVDYVSARVKDSIGMTGGGGKKKK